MQNSACKNARKQQSSNQKYGVSMESVPLLELRGIEKLFPGVKALSNMSFKVKPGSVHVLCGENGAGKSTLCKIINGIYQPDRGEILVDGNR